MKIAIESEKLQELHNEIKDLKDKKIITKECDCEVEINQLKADKKRLNDFAEKIKKENNDFVKEVSQLKEALEITKNKLRSVEDELKELKESKKENENTSNS